MQAEAQKAVEDFIHHHVMNHAGSSGTWNLPFLHVPWLEWLHYDAVMVFVIAALLLLFALRVRTTYKLVPQGAAAIAEAYIVFVRDQIVKPNFGAFASTRIVSFFCTLFIFILTANLLGLVPIFSTATGNINITAGLATTFMVVTLGVIVRLKGATGLKGAFVPHGLPTAILPLMVIMEIIGFASRVFALCMRLFCNLLAGHIVVYSLLGVIVIFGWPALPMLLITILMYFFELFVAFLQAYVFTLLSAIFMGMMLNPEH